MAGTPDAVLLAYKTPGERVADAAKSKAVVDAAIVLLTLVLTAALDLLQHGDFSPTALKAAAVALGITLIKTSIELLLKYQRAMAEAAAPVVTVPMSPSAPSDAPSA